MHSPEVDMDIEIIYASEAPRSYGPYSQATRVGPFVFCSGQAGFDPATGQLVAGGIREQTRQTLRNVETVLKKAGSSLKKVAKITVFLQDWEDFAGMNEVFAEFFSEHPPARSTVQGWRWPEGSLIAIEAIALTEDGK